MEIKIDYDKEKGRVFGRQPEDQQALGTLTGKTSLTKDEFEDALLVFSDVAFTEEKKR